MIKEFLKGQRQEIELEEDYLDWFFLHYFGQRPEFWRSLSDEKIEALVTLQNEKEKQYWETWVEIYKKIHGGKK